MRISEKILFLLSRKRKGKDFQIGRQEWDIDNALSVASKMFPDFMKGIVDKKILDFGCGAGYQSAALARNGAKYVLGIDINQGTLEKARNLICELGLGQQVEFTDKLDDRFKGRFDIVISQNSLEHFSDPVRSLNDMKSALNENGTTLISFGPPWFAPYGSHMQFFTKVPWVNILFDEKTIMNVRAHFRNDGATKYEEVEGGLNRMTVTKFEQIISNTGMETIYKRYDCIRGINFLGKIPLGKELFINHITCILSNSKGAFY